MLTLNASGWSISSHPLPNPAHCFVVLVLVIAFFCLLLSSHCSCFSCFSFSDNFTLISSVFRFFSFLFNALKARLSAPQCNFGLCLIPDCPASSNTHTLNTMHPSFLLNNRPNHNPFYFCSSVGRPLTSTLAKSNPSFRFFVSARTKLLSQVNVNFIPNFIVPLLSDCNFVSSSVQNFLNHN